ncbi:MAG: VOC family protein, partial [Dehalococcoidia bacterium]|nr:VOC family protein [Dehalococcoidia bacterium]
GVLSPLGLELIQSTAPDSAFARFVEKRGEGLFSLCFKVPDIDVAIEELTGMGLEVAARMVLGKTRDVQFHPRDTFGVSVVLTEYPAVHGAEVAGREKPR